MNGVLPTTRAGGPVASMSRPWPLRDRRLATRGMPPESDLVHLRLSPAGLGGELRLPAGAAAVVVLAHDSGGRPGTRIERTVAERLAAAGLGTLRFDLLNAEERCSRHRVFDTALLGSRLREAIAWLGRNPRTRGLPFGLFGSGVGAAAAVEALTAGSRAAAVVLLGGRLDLARPTSMAGIAAPTLLITARRDPVVAAINRRVLGALQCERELLVLDDAGGFDASAAIATVCRRCSDWFGERLAAPQAWQGGEAGPSVARRESQLAVASP
jgi:putative phosphoribosyl transferase